MSIVPPHWPSSWRWSSMNSRRTRSNMELFRVLMDELISRGPTSPVSSRWNGLKAVARNRGRRHAKGSVPSFFGLARGSSGVSSIAVSNGPVFGANFRCSCPKIRSEKLSISHHNRQACGLRRCCLQQPRMNPHHRAFSHSAAVSRRPIHPCCKKCSTLSTGQHELASITRTARPARSTKKCVRANLVLNFSVARVEIHFKWKTTVPSETVGRAVPRLAAFLLIQSRATRMLSSVPALSW